MFRVGDVVVITDPHDGMSIEGSPIQNLDGTIARIKSIETTPYRHERAYHLEFLEIKAKNMQEVEKYQEDCNWKDKHLQLLIKDCEMDIMSLFGE